MVRIRGSVRSRFTIGRALVLLELSKEDHKMDKWLIHDKMALLECLCIRMGDLDWKIIEMYVKEDKSEEDLQKEEKTVNGYKSKWITLQRQADEVLRPRREGNSGKPDSFFQSSKKTYKLPKTEFKKFSGNVMDWLSWWSQLRKIHEDKDLYDRDKFQYLAKAVQEGSKPADLIKVYPQSQENYPKAISALWHRASARW